MADRVGQQLGNYRLVGLLGRGGFAEVYLGEHLHLSTQAAVKVLYARLASKDDMKGFEKEARTIAHLKHPHIVRVLDYNIEEDTPFLVMDYALGGTLRQRHPKAIPLSLTTILSYVKQIANALQYAHNQRVIHRDVKPENMLIGEHDELLLSDFGIAIVAQSSRHQDTQNMGGTVAYIAPEQIQGHPRTTSDQYSLGIVVYEWLTGKPPFVGTFQEVISQHLGVLPHPLHEKLPTISPAVDAVIMKALAKEPKQRFESIQDFATAFEQAYLQSPVPVLSTVQPLPPQYLPPQTVPVGPRTTRRNVLLLSIIGAGLTTAGIGGWLELAHLSAANSGTPLLKATPLPIGTTLLTYRGHSDKVDSVKWSPDSKYIASGSADKTVQIWNTVDGRNVYTYQGHTADVWSAAWSPDGKRIASAGFDQTVQVWNSIDGSHVYTYLGHAHSTTWTGVVTVTWSPDGNRIASAGFDKTVQVWDAADGNHVYTYRGHTDTVWSVAWSPDGKRIASTGADQTVQVWDAIDGSHVYTYLGHTRFINAVAWSPDNKRIASASGDGTVQVWDAADGNHVYIYHEQAYGLFSVAWSPNGKRIASGGRVGSVDNTVQVWDAADGNYVYTYRKHTDIVNAVAWSPDGKYIASGSRDKTVQVWQVS